MAVGSASEGLESSIARRVLVLTLSLSLLATSSACGNEGKNSKGTVASGLASPTIPASEDLLDEGVAAQKAGDTTKARRAYREVLRKDPKNKLALFNLGLIEQNEGRPAGAEAFYEQSLKSDPNYVPALFNLAIVQESTEKNEQAAELYRRIIAIDSDNASAHLNLGFLLSRKLGNVPEGEAELRKAVELDPRLASRVPPEVLEASPAAPPPQP
jgi:tetratricopeptide (TPR) repeat protein